MFFKIPKKQFDRRKIAIKAVMLLRKLDQKLLEKKYVTQL